MYGPPVALNQWTHLVGTYDGTTARLYVNGALVGATPCRATSRTRSARCGSRAAPPTRRPPHYYLPGRVDEVAVYGSALSAARVQAHFAAAGARAAAATSLRTRWRRRRRRAARCRSPSPSTARARAIPTARSPPTPGISTATAPSTTRPRSNPSFHVHGGRHLHRAPAGHRQPRRPGRLRPAHDHGDELGRRHDLQPDRPRRLAACLLAPGRGERHHRRRCERQRPHGLLRELAHARRRRRAHGDSNTAVGFNGSERVRERALHGRAQPGAVHGRGVGVRDRRPGHLPLDRDEPRLLARQRARLHPVRGRRQHLAVLGLGNGTGWDDRVRAARSPSTSGRTWSAPTTARPCACT